MKRKIINLVLIIFWMIIVFSFSNQIGTKSSNTSGKLTKKIVSILRITDGCSEENEQIVLNNIEHIIRKIAHYSIYAIGGFLIYCEFNTFKLSSGLKILFTQIVGSIYACTDEMHQSFIPGRNAETRDVIIDSCGIFAGIVVAFILIILTRYFRIYKKNYNLNTMTNKHEIKDSVEKNNI
jgi:hypothetical protein